MNCPRCGSGIAPGAKYCPVCGADVEEADMKRTASYSSDAPEYEALQSMWEPAPQATPVPHPQPLRSATPKKSQPAPKWPIVLICVLVVLIAIVLLLLFKPWDAGTTDNDAETGNPAVSQTADPSAPADPNQAQVSAQPTVQQTSLDGEEAYQKLMSYYNQLDGYNTEIVRIAESFNANYLTGDQQLRLDEAENAQKIAAALQTCVQELNALPIPQSSSYASQAHNVAVLFDCLFHRADVLAQAWQLSASVADPNTVVDQIGAVLGADNIDGVNKYKTQYENQYASSMPVHM